MLWKLIISKYTKSVKKEGSWRAAFPLDERALSLMGSAQETEGGTEFLTLQIEEIKVSWTPFVNRKTKFWYYLSDLRELFEALWNLFSNTFWNQYSELSDFKMGQTFYLSKQRISLRDYDHDLENEIHGQLIHHYPGKSSLQCLAKPSLVSWLQSFPLVLPLWQCKDFALCNYSQGCLNSHLDNPAEYIYLVLWQLFSIFPCLTSCFHFVPLVRPKQKPLWPLNPKENPLFCNFCSTLRQNPQLYYFHTIIPLPHLNAQAPSESTDIQYFPKWAWIQQDLNPQGSCKPPKKSHVSHCKQNFSFCLVDCWLVWFVNHEEKKN